MEENVALDSSKQTKFVKSIRGIKNLIKKGKIKSHDDHVVPKVHKKRKEKQKGLVYIGHIPHGFYEHEMTQYFRQFGRVTNARVIRSKKTGRSKGYAFVEFAEPAVAKIVAETTNNYLMGKKLLKAAYIPPEKQRRWAKRMKWNTFHNPGSEARRNNKKAYNTDINDDEHLLKARKMLSNIAETKKKLKVLGINYDFFQPVDVPEQLQTEEAEKDATAEVHESADTKKQKSDIKTAKSEDQDIVVKKKSKLRKCGPLQVKEESSDKFQKKKKLQENVTKKRKASVVCEDNTTEVKKSKIKVESTFTDKVKVKKVSKKLKPKLRE